METYLIYTVGAASLVFIATGVYLHMLRKRSESVFPAPFLNPPRKRKPSKK
jgi:uncharacterized iron-regulated membrane protein